MGTPVWNASVSTPVRTYLTANKARIRRVAFFCTYGGWGAERAFQQMENICGQPPIAMLVVREREVGGPEVDAKVRTFASELKKMRNGEPQAVWADLRIAHA